MCVAVVSKITVQEVVRKRVPVEYHRAERQSFQELPSNISATKLRALYGAVLPQSDFLVAAAAPSR
jgi:hypothetical protein